MGAVTRKVLGGVAFPAEEGLCCISRIGFRQVNPLTGVEPNTGLSSLCECKVGGPDECQREERIGRVLHCAGQLFGRPG